MSFIRKPKDPRLPPEVVLKGEDPFTPHLLRDFAARCDETGRSDDAKQARADANALADWQAQYAASKQTDAPVDRG